LASFTAVRGAAPVLRQFKLLKDLDLGAPPDQFFLWSQSHVAFQVFCAWPGPDAPNILQRIADRAPAVLGTNMQQRGLAQISWEPTNQQVAWKGLPVITPFLRRAHDVGKEFIVGGLFPPVPLTNPPPAELLSQLATTNLLCYDWEITQTRLSHGQVMAQLFAIVADKPQFMTNTAGLPWLMAIAPRLGNTVTEITADSPSQWSLTRKSHLGLTAVELIALARWLESTNFPRLSFDLPPARFRRPP